MPDRTAILTLAALSLGLVSHRSAIAEDELLAPMSVEDVRVESRKWAQEKQITDVALLESIRQLWTDADSIQRAEDLHRLTVRTFAVAEPNVATFLEQCRFQSRGLPGSESLLTLDGETFFGSNLRAYVGTYLAQTEFYDEALGLFENVKASQLVDPASYLFHKAVCEQQLLKAEEGLATIKQLLEDTSDVPERFAKVAELMKADLEKLEEKSLDEVSRMMSDVERRLNLGRGGARVQKTEEEIVARLDELIKKLEQQQQQQSQSQSGSGMAPSNSVPDSIIKGSTAPGEVDTREIGKKAGWGALPPKQQAKARNLIDRELPPHYRNAIEQYLRKLATRPESRSR